MSKPKNNQTDNIENETSVVNTELENAELESTEKVVKVEDNKNIVVNIALDPLNPKEDTIKVYINGKQTDVKRGEMVEVSEDIYNVLKTAKLCN